MADRIFLNEGIMEGTYAGTPFDDSHSSLLEVTLAGVTFEKTADQEIWFGGALTITFTIDNTEGQGSLDLIIIRDLLDNTKFDYTPGSVVVQLTDTTAVPPAVTTLTLNTDYSVTYVPDTVEDPTKDSLMFSFLAGGAAASIPVGSIVTISFRGEQVPA